MAETLARRNYSLLGPENRRAVERGLANAEWYASPIPRKTMKELMKRSNMPALRDQILLYLLLIGLGTLGVYTWGSWWGVPVFIVYGALYAGSGDSRWHECGHGTAFKSQWLNQLFYYIACYQILREPTPWRWSHTRHHTDTIIVGRDPEIIYAVPFRIRDFLYKLFNLEGGYAELKKLVLHATGRLGEAEKDYIPASEYRKVIVTARIMLACYAVPVVAALWMGSLLPLMLLGLPSFYGFPMVLFTGSTQHAGLAEDVIDHRLNCRTVYMNPLLRFSYWNMNYHVEHHMFPMVPYHALPRLHALMKDDCPPAYPSCWAAYREIVSTLLRQRRDPGHFVRRQLPPGASPSPVPRPLRTAAAAE